MSQPQLVCNCSDLFDPRVDPWGKTWWLDVIDTGVDYLVIDGNGMTFSEPYCPIHGNVLK